MTLFQPAFANRFLRKYFGSNYVVRDAHGIIGGRFNSLAAARSFAKRISVSKRMRGIKFKIWSGKGFTIDVGISYRDGRRGR